MRVYLKWWNYFPIHFIKILNCRSYMQLYLKRDFGPGVFLWILWNLRTPFLQNTFERLLLYPHPLPVSIPYGAFGNRRLCAFSFKIWTSNLHQRCFLTSDGDWWRHQLGHFTNLYLTEREKNGLEKLRILFTQCLQPQKQKRDIWNSGLGKFFFPELVLEFLKATMMVQEALSLFQNNKNQSLKYLSNRSSPSYVS